MPPRFIEAGNEISLALLDIEFDVFEQYKTNEDRIQARRDVHEHVRQKYGLASAREAVRCREISALVANRPAMIHLFDYDELEAMVMLRVKPTLVDQFIAAKRRASSFGLPDILGLALHAKERHDWRWD
ncbi:hypothetical protein AWB77_04631 [Caballeronia fortuita]|uniref:Uncharacterized protein n=1 Tax=Caballeronia fortuita TaxID=1777138 RepID=A0A158CXE6_9BURK|nr:hypothetical protein [Caballeronia fortuita]SAK86626.1 hypothetical protein AWB77_04631 [Caballeronia fortuita]